MRWHDKKIENVDIQKSPQRQQLLEKLSKPSVDCAQMNLTEVIFHDSNNHYGANDTRQGQHHCQKRH